ncbi:hypothetical protein [Streptomyces misionensis]|uniref:hypothetical protein n=1 Tax=Streptomyces misionensis TaxID=67331 RepID=UPI00369F0B6D
MRALPARRLASTVVGAAVLAAVTGPVAVAVSADSTGDRADTGTSRASLPGAAKLLAQVRAMDRSGSVPKQVVTLLDRSLTEGRLPAAEARRLGDEAKKALERAAAAGTLANPTAPAATPATPTAPAATPTAPAQPAATPTAPAATPTAPATPAQPAKPSAPAVAPSGSESQSAMPKPAASAAKHGATRAVPAARDLLGDVLAAVDALVNAVVSQVDQVVSNAKNLVDLLLASLSPTSTATPAATSTPAATPSLPALPSLPATG